MPKTRGEKLELFIARLKQSWQHYQLKANSRMNTLTHRLQRQDPNRRLQQYGQSFDEMQFRLDAAIDKKLTSLALKQQQLSHRLNQQSPANKLELESQRLSYLTSRLKDSIKEKLASSESSLSVSAHQLQTVSPLATLSRGYSITQDSKGKVLLKASDVSVGDMLTTRLLEGEVQSKVV
ncbi:hypothetical protein SVI_1381 [Shewanella violacea DSS12]|uniref:Exonuclease VII large subunit C-terminal domain-containing protein n=1 Tax=Shewanella violacea (strain JCM 10179 / CIP 106290 / LMG 19151 / DSS12) TaxID=637905 RepID=D4ZI53_SHEVD|nr:exodeoxyribonuclease VII large subunit [Shewanella violacea]BAJ01352.1 hypothetical protein SVI_1381 [Shewanella violacea DSS12]